MPIFSFKHTKEGKECRAATFFCFGFNVIELTCFQMKVRSESKYYHFVALLLPSWPCENSKCEIAFFFLYLAQESLCQFVYVSMCAHLIMGFAPEVAFVDCSAPAALNRR